MLKKTLLAVAIGIIGLSGMPAYAQEAQENQETNYTLIGDFKYNEIMLNANRSNVWAQFEFGTKPENVGGTQQDPGHFTEGFPPAFRGGSFEKEVWILDANNNALKLFENGKLKKNIDIKYVGHAFDFAISQDNKNMVFLDRTSGNVYVADKDGKQTAKVSGFEYATSVEFNHKNEILVVHPMGQGIVKLGLDGKEIAKYSADQTTSNFENEKGLWGLDGVHTNTIKLFVRTGVDPKDVKVLAEFPFKEYKDVEYKGATIFGFDKKGNVYFGLVACDPNGVVYRDRLYKCDQNGKVLKEMDVIDQSLLSPNVPRHRLVNKFGRVIALDADVEKFYIRGWNM